ncbi:hypothetical protein SAMN04487897_13513 [Paenibacillus sp. yr247]|uniref:hypothetical protein n=1 Tax=Paenibacillus sp. yr247 TaxID=1761880 RepID=UPI000885BEA2|nr:hypothetical protein [Paenibacillus sp. yr247]SDP08174.1 hypothetical protein SAMN04487897_13513 [Paenibacillus sp. yr247]
MIKIRIRTKDKKFIVPVPYPILTMLSMILTSKRLLRFANKAIEKEGKSFKVPHINNKDLKPLLQALSEHKGLLVVETKLNDGTEVTVRL